MQRRLRGSGWIAFVIAMGEALAAGNAGCGARSVWLGAQDDAGTSGYSATSGSTNAASAAGTASATSGSANPASSAGATSGTFSAGTGSVTSTPSGSVNAGPPSRCGFTPDLGTTGSAPAPNAPADVVLARIFRFLDDSSVLPVGIPQPAQVTADWAATLASGILDQHFATGTEAPGLVRFLTAWLKVPAPDAGLSAAHTWSVRLLDPGATLTTLLAGPTSEPHRIGILTDPQVLTARPQISGRGWWMEEKLLCSLVPPPPVSADFPPPMPMPGLTRREQLESSLMSPFCFACHKALDTPGFSLEHFDEQGSYRDLDNGKPVDSSGTWTVTGLVDRLLTFTSYDDLAPQLAVWCPVAQCFAKLVMNDAFAVSPTSGVLPFTDEEVNHVANAFANSNFSIRVLVTAIVGTPSFLR